MGGRGNWSWQRIEEEKRRWGGEEEKRRNTRKSRDDAGRRVTAWLFALLPEQENLLADDEAPTSGGEMSWLSSPDNLPRYASRVLFFTLTIFSSAPIHAGPDPSAI